MPLAYGPSGPITYVPNAFDFGLIGIGAGLAAIEVALFSLVWRRPEAQRSSARKGAYVYLIVYQWTLVACILGLWIAQRRAWSILLLGVPNVWGCVVGLALAAVYVWFAMRQRRAVLTRPDLLERARREFGSVAPILPHTAGERRLWPFAAVTAGCCEEIVFRGFLFAFVASFAGVGAAVIVSAGAFGIFHAYYGPSGIVKTSLFGLLMSLLALLAHSLIPVILIHAAADLLSGDLGYYLVSNAAQESA
jgi:uncharacterized protein